MELGIALHHFRYFLCDLVQLLFAGDIGDPDFFETDFAACGFQFFFHQPDALAAPAVGAEGKGLMVLGGKALQVAEEGGDGRHHLVVDGR